MDNRPTQSYGKDMSMHSKARFLDRRSPPHIITLILLAGISAAAMNMFLPSLPSMAAHYQADYRLMQLSVALYLGVSGALQLLIGPISDNLGRRPVLLGGVTLFMVATIGCIFAPTAEIFLICRMCQAVVAVGMVLSRAIIRDLYDQDQAASMIGYVTMGMALVPMITPAIGGYLGEAFGWQANFWAFFAMGALAFALIWFDTGETATKSERTLLQQFTEYPELFRSVRFWGYSMAAGFCSGSFFAYLGGAPFVGSEIFSMSESQLGVWFGAPAIGYFLGNFASGRYTAKIGINTMIFWGSIINATGTLLSLLIFLADLGTPLSFFGMMTFVGFGNGMVIPNATAGLLSVRPHLAGTASGLGGAIMIGGGAGLSALAGAVLSPETGAHPLLLIMFLTSVAGLGAILHVIQREKRLGITS